MIRYKAAIFLILIFIAQSLFSQEKNKENIYKLLYLGKYYDVISLLDEKIKIDSTNAELHFLLGMANTLQGNQRDALKNFEKSYNLDCNNVNNLNYYANTLLKMGYLYKAENIFREAIQLDSMRIDIWDSLGRLYYRNSKFDDSYDIYYMLSQTCPTNGYYYYLMQARCAVKMDSINKAFYCYNIAHDLDPQNIEIILELSRILLEMDSLDKAKTFIQEGLMLDNKNHRLHLLKADILYKQQDYTLAILSFLDAIAYGDRSVEVLKKLGFCYYADRNYLKSKEIFEKSLKLDDEDPIIYFYLGMCTKQMKEYRQAINYFKIALILIHPDFLDNLYVNLAGCHHSEQEFIKAIRYLRKALECSPIKEVVYYDLANVYYDYYEDRRVPLIYYKKAIKKELAPEITEFINQRIKELTEEIFLKQ